jgi:hypothetical protein
MVAGLRVLSDLVNRFNFANQAGITFGGDRDLYNALGYKKVLEFTDYNARYRRGGIAKRVIEQYPKYTWRGDIEVVETEDPEAFTPFEQMVYDLQIKHQLWSTFNRLDVLSGIGRYAVLYIVTEGDPGTPLTSLSLDNIVELIPLSEQSARIDASNVVRDTKNPRYGMPDFYTIQTDTASLVQARKVHHTRCLHVVTDPLESMIYGIPRLECVWNDLDDLDKVRGGGSEAFWQRAHRGYQFDIDKDMSVTPDDKAAMSAAIDEFKHNLTRVLRTRGVTTTEFGSDVADFKNPVDCIVSLISGATSIPQRMLLGSERGELASTQDKDNWDDMVSERQNTIAEPRVIRPFIDRLIELGALPQPTEYHTHWPEREEITPSEQVDMANKAADINRKMGETVILAEEVRTRYLGLEPFTPAQQREIAAIEEQDAADAQAQLDAQNAQNDNAPVADNTNDSAAA